MIEDNIKFQQWDKPEKPNWKWWMPWDNQNITHKWVITFNQDAILDGQTYSSSNSNQHAILVTNGTVTISDANITKTGDSEWDTSDFYWTNAAAISINWQLWLHNVTINTNWKHANAIFAYGSWNVFIADSTITTKDDNSWWIMVTWWWNLGAENLTITTEWNSSAAIRSDRWGGEMQIERWDYTTNWVWSPVIYSTANITVSHANLTANKSEWAIVEWKNSITISNSTLTDSNTVLNWQSTTYKNIFLYQSMSWDADEWTAKFTAIESKIITNNWDTIYITNTTAEILLQNNEIINKNWDFLRIEWAARGKQGSNWWDVTLNLINQNIKWDIIVDNISSLSMSLTEWSSFQWAINSENQSQNISIKLDSTSTWNLTSDSYISEISSNAEWYSNINLNGHTLYIWETKITSVDQIQTEETWNTTQITEATEDSISTGLITDNLNSEITWINIGSLVIWWIGIIAIIAVIWICIKVYIKK